MTPIIDRRPIDMVMKSRRKHPTLKALVTLVTVAALATTALSCLEASTTDRDGAASLGELFEHDISVDSINSPVGPTVSGNVVVNATVTNYGTSAETDVEVNLTISKRVGGEVMNESFEDSFPPTGWESFAPMGYTETPWSRTSSYKVDGTYSAMSAGSLNQNSVLSSGSQSVHIDPGADLSFWVRRDTDATGYTFLDVWVSSTAFDPFNFGSVGTNVLGLNNWVSNNLNVTWEKKTVDLSAHEGQDLYIAFNHYYGDNVYMDLVIVGSPDSYEPIFYDTEYITSIESGGHAYVEFDAWSALTGDYTVNVSARLAGDLYLGNDYVTVAVTGEIVIPEFSLVLVPILGLVLIVMVARRRGRNGQGPA